MVALANQVADIDASVPEFTIGIVHCCDFPNGEQIRGEVGGRGDRLGRYT